MLAICGAMLGLPGCTGVGTDATTTPTTTDTPTTAHESTTTQTSTQSPTSNYSLVRTRIIDADNIDDSFGAPALEQVVIGRDIAIVYEVEVPVRDGTYDAVVHVGLIVLGGHHASTRFFQHEGSADGESTRIVGHLRQPTDDFLPKELRVYVAVADELPGPQDHERFDVQIVQPTEERNGDS